MEVVYAKEDLPSGVEWDPSIFLAGPTPRGGDDKAKSWRPKAMELLKAAGFRGVIFNPESRHEYHGDYLDQIEWEQEHRGGADLILFWVPRKMPDMPAFTTNVEFGEDYRSEKMLYGRPDWAYKTRYLDFLYRQTGKEPASSLDDLIDQAIKFLKTPTWKE